MKMLLLYGFLSTFSIISSAQDPVVVVEKSIKIGGTSPATEYYGFAKGDKLVFNLSLEKGEIKDVSITEYPGTVKFSDHSVEKIENKVILIPHDGVYKFDYYNSNLLPRNVNIKIQRIPKDESTRAFNTNIIWVDKIDTVALTQQETFVIAPDTSFEEVINTKVQVPSNANQDFSNRTVFDFVLPASTLKWVYWIGTGAEGQSVFEKDGKQFSEKVPKPMLSSNPMSGLPLGLSSLSQLKEGNMIHYYFISTGEETQKFSKNLAFKFFKQGESPVDFALMNYANKNPQKYFVALRNDNPTQNLEVSIKILAMIVTSKYKAVTVTVPTLLNHKVPINDY